MPKIVIPTWVYILEALDAHAPLFVKVGVSRSVEARIMGLQTGCPVKVSSAKKILLPSNELARMLESGLHRELADSNSSGEWFRFDDPEEGRGRVDKATDHFLKYRSRWKFEPVDLTSLRKTAKGQKDEEYLDRSYKKFLVEQKRRVSRNYSEIKLPDYAKHWVLTRPKPLG